MSAERTRPVSSTRDPAFERRDSMAENGLADATAHPRATSARIWRGRTTSSHADEYAASLIELPEDVQVVEIVTGVRATGRAVS